jgi:hypothetical protein
MYWVNILVFDHLVSETTPVPLERHLEAIQVACSNSLASKCKDGGTDYS